MGTVEYRAGLPTAEQVKAHEERTRAWCAEHPPVAYPGEGCFWQVTKAAYALPEYRLLLSRGTDDGDFRIREAAERNGGGVVCMPSDYGVLPLAPSESLWRPCLPDGTPYPWPGEPTKSEVDRATFARHALTTCAVCDESMRYVEAVWRGDEPYHKGCAPEPAAPCAATALRGGTP